jgi:anti-sigma factor ChrR (cupin superfamily)
MLSALFGEAGAMEINADFTRRVVVHAGRLAWVPSPIAGVDRRMLDRVGDEIARATSIVRYAPESRFSAHAHGGGEEFIVLDGVFEDEHGQYPAGSYIRNPPTSRHTPGSGPGCLLFVKLWQFDLADRTEVRIDSGTADFMPAAERPGVRLKSLFRDAREDVRIERWAPRASITLPTPDGAEFLVLDGGFTESSEAFEPHSWLRLPCDSALQAIAGLEGCRVWVKTGHLRHIEGLQPV